MSSLEKRLMSCYVGGNVDMKKLMELSGINFDNLGLDDVRYIESEMRDLRSKFDQAEKEDCYKTYKLFEIGFNYVSYFRATEIDLVKKLSNDLIEKGWFDFKVEKVSISKDVLEGHIRDRLNQEKFNKQFDSKLKK